MFVQIFFDYYGEFEISEQLPEAAYVFTCSMAVGQVFVFKRKVVNDNAVSMGSSVDFIAVQLRRTLRNERNTFKLGVNAL